MDGFIKIHRKMTEWGWYSDPNTKAVFLHLLLTANWQPGEYRGYKLNPGDAVIGSDALATTLGMTRQQVRTALKKLGQTGEITRKVTNKFTVVTIVKWAKYQIDGSEDNQQTTNNQPTDNQQTTNNQPTDNQQITNNQPTDNQQITTPKESKKERKQEGKKVRKQETIAEVLAEAPTELIPALNDFVEFRKAFRNTPFTPKALRMIINKVCDLSGGDIETSKAILYQSIEQGWKSVYPVKPGERDKSSESNNPFLDMLREEQYEQTGNP